MYVIEVYSNHFIDRELWNFNQTKLFYKIIKILNEKSEKIFCLSFLENTDL